MSVGEAFIAFI